MNMPLHVELLPDVPLPAVVTTLRRLVDLHDALRVRIRVQDGQPVQWLDEERPPRIDVVDGSQLPARTAQLVAARIAEAQIHTPFDLEREPPIRLAVVRMPDSTRVLLTVHHVVFDGQSEAILLAEADAHLTAILRGAPAPHLEAGSYLRYARRRAEVDLSADVEFWTARLADVESALVLPERDRRGARRTRARRRLELTPEESATLRGFAATHDLTLFTVVLAAVAQTLADLSGRQDVVLAIDFGERPAEAENVIGLFVNQMLLHCEVAGDFVTTCSQVRRSVADVIEHPHAPYAAVLHHLRRTNPALAKRPYQVKMSHLRRPPRSGSGTWRVLPGLPRDVDENLTLLCQDAASVVTVVAEYSPEVFDDRTVDALLIHCRSALGPVLDRNGER
jgi:hypothetical protein